MSNNGFYCKICHQDFANRSEFLFHTRTDEHKAIKEAEEQAMKEPKFETMETTCEPEEREMNNPKPIPSNLIIPTNFLPPEVKYLKSGSFIGVKVFGKYNKELGLTVQNVELMRK